MQPVLGILTCLWRRPAVAAAVMAHYRALMAPMRDRGIELVLMAVTSPEDPEPMRTPAGSEDIQFAAGWHIEHAPNAPLSEKWNQGMAALQTYEPEAVMVIGSDDLVSAAYLEAAAATVRGTASRPGADLVMFDTLHCYELATGRAMVAQPRRLGGGRTLSARVLRRVGWQPWPAGVNRRLDGGMDRWLSAVCGRVQAVTLKAERVPGAVVLGLKSDVGLWTYDQVADWYAGDLDAKAVRALFTTHFPTALPLLDMATKKTPESEIARDQESTSERRGTVAPRGVQTYEVLRPYRVIGQAAKHRRGERVRYGPKLAERLMARNLIRPVSARDKRRGADG